jgi:hypothetical protein
VFKVEDYMERMERDNDYYLFWAEEILSNYMDELILCDSLLKTQIAVSHILMDEGQEENYQEDGFILGDIIFATTQIMKEGK